MQISNHRLWRRLALTVQLGLMSHCVMLAQQTTTVSGQVLDNFGAPIPGAAVVVAGSTQGTVTDASGNYSLQAPVGATIKVSFIGYDDAQMVIPADGKASFVLQEEFTELNELVVVGYGVQKKSDVTGAVVNVGADELTSMPVSNAIEGLQGRAAGVDITTNQRPGEVGGISIRGTRSISASNSPLYVIDGMVMQTAGLEGVNPQDIESIDILKDASATAIYGSRGANGVVIVTTKNGKEGKLTLNYAGTLTLSRLHNEAEMMNAAEWLEYSRHAKAQMGSYNGGDATPDYESDKQAFGSVAASWANIEKAWEGGKYDPSKVGSFDWESYGEQQGVAQEHTLSASGGTDKMHGYASFGYLNQKGVQPGQEYKRYTLKAQFDVTPIKAFSMGASLNLAYSDQDYGYSFTKSVTGAGDYYSALRAMLPWTVPYDENGDFIRNPNGDVNIINPIDELNYCTNQRRNLRLNGMAFAQLNFGEITDALKGLTYRIQVGPEFRHNTEGTANAADGINGDGQNKAKYTPGQSRAYTLDNIINYNRTFADKHNLGITLMQSASEYHAENATLSGNVHSPEELWYNIGSNKDLTAFGTSLTEKSMASYMVRVNYSFDDRYMLTASMRWDGASQLSDGNKWDSFPSVALGWRLDQENFLYDKDWLDQLKLRLGFGASGNAAISAYATKGSLQENYYNFGTTSSTLGYLPSDASAKTPASMANQDLGWERTTQFNLGVDFSMLRGRINGSIDYYHTKTTDLLLAMTIPSLTGYTSTYSNVGETSGYGLDIEIGGRPVVAGDFEWETRLTWSMDRSEIKALSNGRTEDVNNGWFVGEEIGVYYDYVYDGIWKSSEVDEAAKLGVDKKGNPLFKPGNIKVKDLNGDEKIDANDKAIVGYARPRWTAGWQNTFSWRGLELSCFIVSRWDFTIPQGAMTLDGRFQSRKVDYWVKDVNENAEYYAPGINGEAKDTYASSQNYQDGSFIKMRNISLGYTFGKPVLNAIGLSSLKVYAQVLNPFFISKKCDWLDPDMTNYDNNSTSAGSLTTQRSFVFGLNFGF